MTSKETTQFDVPLDNGYLFCRNCQGYYHLQDDESIDDFASCECGGELEFYSTLPTSSDDYYHEADEIDESVEIEKLLTLIQSKSKKRKAMLKDLSNHIEIQEELLSEIKEERWNIWDVLNERNLQSDIKNQKRILDDITDNEDRLLSIVQKQRTHAKESEPAYKDILGSTETIAILILLFIVVVVLLLLLIF